MQEEEKHLSYEQVEYLVEASSGASQGSAEPDALEDARRHVSVCEECRTLVVMQRRIDRRLENLRAEEHPEPSPVCPDEGELVELVTGRLPPPHADRLLDHVITCGRCGPILRRITEFSDEPLSLPQESMIRALNSSTPAWRRDLLKRLRDPGASKRRSWTQSSLRLRGLGLLPRLSYLGATALLLALGIWLLLRASPERSAERLIAEAYSQQRTLELRIPGAPYGPLRSLRGAENSRLNQPTALLEAEALIADKAPKRPDDPTWLNLTGQANLLDGDSAAAISALQRAHELSAENLRITLNLATAYFLRAERLNRPIDYGTAAEILGQVLATDPNNGVALFNRAIVQERIFLYQQAAADWERFLRLNPHSDWSEEARVRLEALRHVLHQRSERLSKPLMGPSEFAHDLAVRDDQHIQALDCCVETYLDAALRHWLPSTLSSAPAGATEKAAAERGLTALATVLKNKHADTWLEDLLRGRGKDSSFDQGLRDLVKSYRANDKGDYDRSIMLARKADLLFAHTGNKAALLQAGWQDLYATRLSYRSQECIGLSRPLWRQLENTSYYWLRARVALDYAQCASLNNLLPTAKRLATISSRESRKRGFADLNLKATKVAADIALTMDEPSVAFESAVEGLRRYWKSDAGYMSGYNLYSSLDDGAEAAQLWNLDASFIREALDLAHDDPDSGMKAVMQQRLADALFMSGDETGATLSLNLAQTLLARMSRGEAVQAKMAEIQVRFATIEGLQDKATDAIRRLRAVHDIVLKTGNNTLSLDFFSAYGKAQNAAGHSEAALQALLQAVRLAETGMRTLAREPERLQWIRRSGQVYREVVRLQLRTDPAAAFSWWELYKAASLPRPSDFPDLTTSQSPNLMLSSVASNIGRSIGPQAAILSYAVFPDGIASWIYDGRNLKYHWLAASRRDVEVESRVFSSLCSDPRSDVSSLVRHGRTLYEILVRPIQPLLQYKYIIVEPDAEIANVPFEALIDAGGRFWGDSQIVSYSPGLLYLSHSAEPYAFHANSRVLVLGESSAHPELNLAALPEAETEAREIAAGFEHATLLLGANVNLTAVSRELPAAELFHFSGHAIANASRSGLVLRNSKDENDFNVFSGADISGFSAGATRLVVLSACASAIGTEGYFTDTASLARSFMALNVAQVIASRWSVDSESSRALMLGFYGRMHSGFRTGDALHFAQADLRKKAGMGHPFYWAAFTMFGKT